MKKTNIRSFRFTDDVLEILESMDGDNLSAKFENLVYSCYGKVDKIQRDYEYYKKLSDSARQDYYQVSAEVLNQRRRLRDLQVTLDKMELLLEDVTQSVIRCGSDPEMPG